jgi:hypothetical protein
MHYYLLLLSCMHPHKMHYIIYYYPAPPIKISDEEIGQMARESLLFSHDSHVVGLQFCVARESHCITHKIYH